ncbi:MSHA biogenesis protein MshN [Gammaproteobacteria bacterium]
MSLLNDMLRNLEKRNQDQAKKQIGRIVLSGLQAAAPIKKQPWRLVCKTFIICFVVFLLIMVGYLSINLVNLPKLDFLGFKTQASNPKPITQAPNPPKPKAILQNIFINRGNSEIVIQFTFDMVVHYQLSENSNHSQSTITLNDVSFNASLPLLPVDFVKTLTAKTVGNDLQITMETMPGTEIKVMQNQMQKPMRLVFILTNTQKPITLAQPTMNKTLVPPTSEELALADYQDALNFIDHGYPDQAIPLLTKVVHNDPELVAARKILVTLLMQHNDINRATDYVKAGLKTRPDATELIELDAKLLLIKHSPKEALKTLQKASPPVTQQPEYYALLASVQQQLGHPIIAEQIYAQLLTFDSGNANWWVGMGLALESQNKNNNALQAYKQATQLGSLSSHLQANVQEKIARLTR